MKIINISGIFSALLGDRRRVSVAALAYGGLLILSPNADAAFLSGTFSGAIDAALYINGGGEDYDFDGTPVTGSFSLDSISGAVLDGPYSNQNFQYYNLPYNKIDIKFSTSIGNLDYSGSSSLALLDVLGEQSLVMGASTSILNNGYVSLGGPDGSIFSNFNLETIHTSPNLLADAGFITNEIEAGVSIDSIDFTATPPSAVPLPPSSLLFMTAFLGLAAAARSALKRW